MIATIVKYYAPGRYLPDHTSHSPVPAWLPTGRNCVYIIEYERCLRESEKFEERLRQFEKQAAMEGVQC